MRDFVASVFQLAGVVAVVIGSFILSTVVGLFALGVALVAVGLAVDPSWGRK